MLKLHDDYPAKDWILMSKDGKQRIKVHSLVILDKWIFPGKISCEIMVCGELKKVQTTVSSLLLPVIVDYCYNVGFQKNGDKLLEENGSWVILQLIRLAKALKFEELLNEIFDFLVDRISPDSSIRLWQLCKKYSVERHTRMVFDYLLYNLAANFSYSLCIDWLQLSADEVNEILRDVNLNVHSENEVFYLTKLWIDDDPKRLKQIPNFCSLLRFGSQAEVEQFKQRETSMTLTELNSISFTIGHENRVFRDLIMIIGGSDAAFQKRRELTVYNPCKKQWQICDSIILSQPVSDHVVVELNKDIYIIGGLHNREHTNAVKKLNTRTGEFETLGPMNDKRSKMCAAVFNGQIYVMGGENREGVLFSTEKYDPKTNQWTFSAPMSKSRSNAAATELNGKIYVTGGVNNVMQVMDSVEVLDANSKQEVHRWITLYNTMTIARQGHSVIRWNNALMIAGGKSNRNTTLNSVELFGENIIGRQCHMPAMKNARADFAMIAYRGEVYAVGGIDLDKSPLNSVEKFDANIWTEEKPFWDRRSGHAICIARDCPQLLRKVVFKDSLSKIQKQ